MKRQMEVERQRLGPGVERLGPGVERLGPGVTLGPGGPQVLHPGQGLPPGYPPGAADMHPRQREELERYYMYQRQRAIEEERNRQR